MLGAIIGDISGSRFEWANIKTKEFEFLTYRCAVTDDSVMSLAVAQAILDCDGEYSRLDEHAVGRMREIGGLYPNCGYGGMFKRWLFSQEPQPYNSYGNGAAMRVSACGFAANNLEEVKLLVRKVTEVTHNHSEGIKGAEATAVCVFLARNGMNILELRDYVNAHYYPLNFTLNGIRDAYKFDVSCQGTVPQAIMAFLESAGFEDAIRNAISIGGDSDTLAAITGGIAEAYYGIPPDIRKHALTFLDERLTRIIVNFENAFPPAMEKHGNSQSGTISLKANLDSAVAEQVTAMLLLHFTNGYRLDSPIELARFRAFAAEELGEGITLPDEKLKRCISTCGITYAGKVYAVSTQTKERIKELAEKHFADGAQAIFFAEFYAKNGNWLFDASIVSETMLIGVLSRLFPNLSFTQAYFGYTDASVVSVLESEILRVWGDNVLLTYAQIAERLQYIPMARIRSTLGQNRDFIWNSRETFSHVSRIDITNEERETICEAATRECKARGYFSIAGLPSGEIEARNDELSITALHSAVFRICLSDKFDENGKIITCKGDNLDALTIMKNYCRTIDKCSLNDLMNYAKTIIGYAHRLTLMEAGNTVLVRIDRDSYVSDKYVYFDSDVMDGAIELFISGNYLPLKSFTTFGTFPDCGQTWNLFLLESYCRRFSKKFKFDNLSVNSQNIGAVIRKSCDLKYIEIMTDAVVTFGVPMTASAVGEFLLNSGYIGRKRATKIGEVIDKAKVSQKRVD